MIKTLTKNLKTIAAATLLCASTSGFAQIYWDFGTTSAYPASGVPANLTVDSLTRGNSFGTPASPLVTTTSASTGYTGASGGGNAGVPARIGPLDYNVDATTGSAFFEVIFTPATGYYVDITDIAFGSRSTATGPREYSIRSSVDAFASEAAGDTILSASSAWGLRTETLSITGAPGTAVTLRIYGYDGSGSPTAGTTNFRIDDLSISASAVDLATGISSNSSAEAVIYPNPSSNGILTVDGISGKTIITVFNILGKTVFSAEVNAAGKQNINLSSQANGSYFVRIITNNTTTTKKITLNR